MTSPAVRPNTVRAMALLGPPPSRTDVALAGVLGAYALVEGILLGVAVHRAGLLPGWVGAGLPIAMVMAIVPAALGSSAVTGAYLIAVGAGIVRAATAGGGARATVARA